MCLSFGGSPPPPPPPPPLAPPPPPPEPPRTPTPAPEPVQTGVNPQVQRAKSKKDKNPMAKGTGALRIKKSPNVNQAGNQSGGLTGGLNK
tara:strand:- start:81 stop:350 length:270 start_codon:yes stop_codon:yes gene_type:complete